MFSHHPSKKTPLLGNGLFRHHTYGTMPSLLPEATPPSFFSKAVKAVSNVIDSMGNVAIGPGYAAIGMTSHQSAFSFYQPQSKTHQRPLAQHLPVIYLKPIHY